MGSRHFNLLRSKNAQKTLLWMGFLMGILFIGSISLTQFLGVIASPNETILSASSHRLLGFQPRLLPGAGHDLAHPGGCGQYQFSRVFHAWRPFWPKIAFCRGNLPDWVTAWYSRTGSEFWQSRLRY